MTKHEAKSAVHDYLKGAGPLTLEQVWAGVGCLTVAEVKAALKGCKAWRSQNVWSRLAPTVKTCGYLRSPWEYQGRVVTYSLPVQP